MTDAASLPAGLNRRIALKAIETQKLGFNGDDLPLVV